MTIGKLGHCRWWVAPVVNFWGLTAAAAAAAVAWAQPIAQVNVAAPFPSSANVQREEHFYLDVVLNYVPLHQITHFVRRDGRFYSSVRALQDMGLQWPGMQDAADLVALDDVPGLLSRYDEADQKMELIAPVALLSRAITAFGYETPQPPDLDPLTRAPGLLFNYDFYGHRTELHSSLGAWSELRLFGLGLGLWRSSSITRSTTSSGVAGGQSLRSTRLDTSWQVDFPQNMLSLTLGDAYSSSLAWTRSMRFAGVRISRNFSLQPYRATVPLASFVGEAALPSVVDLYINGIREAQSQVAPGRFQAVGAPVLNGAGSAQMVITDITGQSRVVNFSVYNSARLLQQGLSDWSLEAGKVRRNYGLQSFSYAHKPMLSASARHGLSNALTVETHAESTDGLRMGGVGALLRLGSSGGVINSSYAASRNGFLRGQQRSLGYEWQGRRLSLSFGTQRRNKAFQDVASLEGSILARRTDQIFAGLNVGPGQAGISYVRQDYWSSSAARYAGISWAQALGRYGHIHLGANRDLSRHGATTAYMYWSLPFGENRHMWASRKYQAQGSATAVGAMQALAGDSDGWGWRTQVYGGEQTGAEAEVSHLSRYGHWRAGVETWRGQRSNTLYAAAAGGMLLMQGKLFAMRRVHDAFALVSTDGIADVPVMLENRFVGKTDQHGLLLVTPLNAWQNNDLSIDALVLPADVSVQQVRMMAAPSTGSGMLARFPMAASMIVELSLRGPDGQWVPPGTAVAIEPGKQQATVGYEGRLYLQDPAPGARVRAAWLSSTCSVQLPQTLPVRGRMDLGVLPCS